MNTVVWVLLWQFCFTHRINPFAGNNNHLARSFNETRSMIVTTFIFYEHRHCLRWHCYNQIFCDALSLRSRNAESLCPFPRIWISALILSISIVCNSRLQSGSVSSWNWSCSSMRIAFLRSLLVSGMSPCELSEVLTKSLLCIPSQCRLGRAMLLTSWDSATDPYLYVESIPSPSGSKSKRP